MSIIGLWHGAAWHFVIWGGLQGVCMGIERALQNRFPGFKAFYTSRWKVFSMLLSFSLFNIIAIFFRSAGITNALKMFRALFTENSSNLGLYTPYQSVLAIVVIVGVLIVHWRLKDSSIEEGISRMPDSIKSALLVIMFLAIILFPVRNSAFIYFQF
jgi:alginate O-acetyltransferase complex protein AlgI